MSGGGGGGGAGGGLITDANARLLVDDWPGGDDVAVADVQDRPLIDWGTDVPPPVLEAGDAIAIAAAFWQMDWGESAGSYSGSVYTEGPPIVPALGSTHATYYAWSWAGFHNIPQTFSPCPFGGPGAWAGWREREIWLDLFVVPSHPTDMAGIDVVIEMGAGQGYAPGASIRVLGTAPTAGRQGVVVATVGPNTTTTVHIPASLVPDAGGHLWLGIGPSWQADYGPFGAQCGVATFQNPVLSGHYGSGRIALNTVSAAAWSIYSDPGGDLGVTVELDGEVDPFPGGNTIQDAGIEGSPSTEVSGGALRVTGPGGRCFAVVGDREDEDEPEGVWGDPYRISIPFEVDAIGDGPGLSHIEVTTTRPGLRAIGTIHLGDSTRDPGISVTVGATTVYAPVTITTGERWRAIFDDRSGSYFRGKLWREADGEPTGWDVEVAIPEDGTEDIADRLELCVRADTGQTVVVHPIAAAADAPQGWVHEFLGVADGITSRFPVSHPGRDGTVSLDIHGSAVHNVPLVDGYARLDYMPTRGSTIWAIYLTE